MRSNGAGKLPSLDWRIGFASGFSNFTSRVVSTGNNVFINLGGVDFALGEEKHRAHQPERGGERQGRRARRGRDRPPRGGRPASRRPA